MCGQCLDELGARQEPITAEIQRAADLITALYEDHPTGGELHVVVDDYNVESLEWCAGLELSDLERSIVTALRPMSPSQQAAAIGLAHGEL